MLPVGGVRAKVLAAERAGVRRVVVPEDCRAEVPKDVRIEVVYVRELREAVDAAEGLTNHAAATKPAKQAKGRAAASRNV